MVESFVTIDKGSYDRLIRESERYRVVGEAVKRCLEKKSYGLDLDNRIINTLVSVYQFDVTDEYDETCEECNI